MKRIICIMLTALLLLPFAGCAARDAGELSTTADPTAGTAADDSKPPILILKTTQGSMTNATAALLGGYSWTYPDPSDPSSSLTSEADAAYPTDIFDDLPAIDRAEAESGVSLVTEGNIISVVASEYGAETLTETTLDPADLYFPMDGDKSYAYIVTVEFPSGTALYYFKIAGTSTADTGTRPGNHPILSDPVPPSVYTSADVQDYRDYACLLTSAALCSAEGNTNLSPLSLYLALAMVTNGAEGDTKAQLLQLLGAADTTTLNARCRAYLDTLSSKDDTLTLQLADSLWLRKEGTGAEVNFSSSFLEAVKVNYDATAEAVDFTSASAAQRIAAWIKENTGDTLEPDLEFEPDTLMALVNTVYLLAKWQEPFDETLTDKGDFTLSDGSTVQADFMHQSLQTQIVEGNGYVRTTLPLRGLGGMTLVLPNEGVDLAELIGSMEDVKALLYNDDAARNVQLALSLPRFSFDCQHELASLVEALGCGDAFNGDMADFSALSDAQSYISRILQGTHIDVNEKGVEASAFTMIVMRDTAIWELDSYTLNFDRPFLFAITASDGTLLFVGVVQNPA